MTTVKAEPNNPAPLHSRKVVYVAHCLAGPERDSNRRRAAWWCGWLARHFKIAPVADWIVLSGEWEETDENRARGIEIDLALVGRCDELWMVGPRISAGMRIEATAANGFGVVVRDLTGLAEDTLLQFPTAELLARLQKSWS